MRIKNLEIPPSTITPDAVKIISLLGEGSTATVFKAMINGTNSPCALKLFDLSLHHDPKDHERERKILQQLTNTNTPNVVHLIGYYKTVCSYALIMQCGSPLSKELAGFDFNSQFQIIQGLSRAVFYLHHLLKIIHCDINIDNVLVMDGEAKLCDFGFARTDSELKKIADVCGTPEYMAPEILKSFFGKNDAKNTKKSDIYSLGMTMWAVMSKTPASEKIYPACKKTESLYDIVIKNKERPAIPDTCPQQINQLIHKLWHHKPEKRPTAKKIYQQVDELSATFFPK